MPDLNASNPIDQTVQFDYPLYDFRKLEVSFSECIMEANQEEKIMDKNIIQVALEGIIC